MAWFRRNPSGGKKTESRKKGGARTRRGPGSRTGAKARSGDGTGFLSREQRGEILALAFLASALFVVLSLLPVEIFGSRADDWFPSGNVVGLVGGTIQVLFFAFAGIAAACVPVFLLLVGLRVGGWLAPSRSWRLLAMTCGVFLLLPPLLVAAGRPSASGGWLGDLAARPLIDALGTFGALLLLGLLFVILSIGTLGWNPLRPLFRGIASSGRAAGGSLALAVERYGERRRERAAARRERAVARAEERAAARDAGRAESAAAAGASGALAGGPDGAGHAEAGGTGSVDDFAAAASAASAGADDPQGAAVVKGDANGKASAGATFKWGRKKEVQDDLFPDPTDPRDLEGGDLPSLDLLTLPPTRDRTGLDRELDALGEVLVQKLDTFNVKSSIGGRTTGPVVTQFEVVPAPGVKVNKIANLDADLALAMRAQTIRIVAPIPGKGAVGVEIPNPKPEMVHLHAILDSRAYRGSRAELPLALGEDLTGDAYVADLTKMPHVLIAGATGAGKSVCLNTIITSLVYRHTPETLRLLLIDPKMVELSTYGDLPHLRHPVVTDPKEAAGVLKWAVLEMERRYTLLSENGVRSLAEFNRRVKEGVTLRRAHAKGEEGDPDRWVYDDGILPFIVLVLDELADLMMTVQGEVEKPLTHLAQKARAIGIHLIVATQRPSVNVITGLIKANFPCRIAFRVASKVDSRTILDQNGADALLGNGDMLFLPPGQSEPLRVQGAYIGTDDTNKIMEWFRERARLRIEELEEGEALPPSKEEDILDQVRSHEAQEATEAAFGDEGFADWDDLFQAAAEVCIQQDQGSTSLLQRKLRIGYGRAARIVDQLHDAGVLGAPDGSKPREVLMSMSEIESMFNPKARQAAEEA